MCHFDGKGRRRRESTRALTQDRWLYTQLHDKRGRSGPEILEETEVQEGRDVGTESLLRVP